MPTCERSHALSLVTYQVSALRAAQQPSIAQNELEFQVQDICGDCAHILSICSKQADGETNRQCEPTHLARHLHSPCRIDE